MATERKFAISTTPDQPGYEATYETVNDCINTLGDLDLTALDQKIILEVFPDYGPGVYSSTGQGDMRNWTTDITADQYVEIRPVAGSEFVYPAMTGSRIQLNHTNTILRCSASAEAVILDLGMFSAANAIWGPIQDGRACVIDRCYAEFSCNEFRLYEGFRFSNSIYKCTHTAQTSSPINATGTAYVINVTGIAGAEMIATSTRFFRNVRVINCVFLKESGTGFDGTGFYSNGAESDYNASVEDSAPGANSIQNIVAADEFVNPDSDVHLKETSQLRGAGANQFGNGYDKDIDRDDRPNAAWDIGADQFTGAVPPAPSNNAIFHGTEF